MLEWLKTILGDSYTDEIDKKVSTEIGKDFVARKDFNDLNESKKALDKTIKERDGQLEELKKVDAAGLQAKIIELQTANDAAKTEYEAEVKKIKLQSTLETRLLKDGAVNNKAVLALLDTSKIALDGENLVGYDDQIKGLKESEKWAFQAPAAVPGKTGVPQGAGGAAEPTLADAIKSQVYGTNSK